MLFSASLCASASNDRFFLSLPRPLALLLSLTGSSPCTLPCEVIGWSFRARVEVSLAPPLGVAARGRPVIVVSLNFCRTGRSPEPSFSLLDVEVFLCKSQIFHTFRTFLGVSIGGFLIGEGFMVLELNLLQNRLGKGSALGYLLRTGLLLWRLATLASRFNTYSSGAEDEPNVVRSCL